MQGRERALTDGVALGQLYIYEQGGGGDEGSPEWALVVMHVGQARPARIRDHALYTTVKATFWPWLSGESLQNLEGCSLFARRRLPGAVEQARDSRVIADGWKRCSRERVTARARENEREPESER